MENYLGLDLSLTGTGVVVFAEDEAVLYAHTIKNDLRGPERLIYIRDTIQEVIRKYEPAMAVIEAYIMHTRTGQAFGIGELGGVIRVLLHESECEWIAVSPTAVKKFVTGKGNAEKDHMLLEVYKRFGYEAKDNNVADAYGLARIAYHLHSGSETYTAFQREVIAAIQSPEGKKEKKAKKEKKVVPTLLKRTSR